MDRVPETRRRPEKKFKFGQKLGAHWEWGTLSDFAIFVDFFNFFTKKLKNLSELNLEWTWFDEPRLGKFEFRWTYPNL